MPKIVLTSDKLIFKELGVHIEEKRNSLFSTPQELSAEYKSDSDRLLNRPFLYVFNILSNPAVLSKPFYPARELKKLMWYVNC